ncbi:unnamed protein product [Rhizophagus irregularis]|nr:unnamed protein product [Rhizophagus irregularis]CAB4426645.1 unnamed protein product [Rhizophagus irregularis]
MAEITSENIDYVAFSLRSKVTRSNTYAQIENKLLMKREDHSSAISNRPGENSKTLGKDHRTTTLQCYRATIEE